MKNTTDFIFSLMVENEHLDEITEKNYKNLLDFYNAAVTVSENDNDLLEKNLDTLVENWELKEEHTRAEFAEMSEKFNKLETQIKGNKEHILKCENTIKIIELYAEIKGWE